MFAPSVRKRLFWLWGAIRFAGAATKRAAATENKKESRGAEAPARPGLAKIPREFALSLAAKGVILAKSLYS